MNKDDEDSSRGYGSVEYLVVTAAGSLPIGLLVQNLGAEAVTNVGFAQLMLTAPLF